MITNNFNTLNNSDFRLDSKKNSKQLNTSKEIKKNINQEKDFKKCQEIINNYIETNGTFVVISKRNNFSKTLRQSLKYLNINKNIIYTTYEPENIKKTIEDTLKMYDKVTVFFDEDRDGNNLIHKTEDIESYLDENSNIICLMEKENQPEEINLMKEMGVDNVITKLITPQSLTKELALTINSENKIDLYKNHVESFVEKNEIKEAKENFKNIFPEESENRAKYLFKAEILRKRKEYKEAEKCYICAIKKIEDPLIAFKKLKEFYEETEEHNKKLKILKKIDEISPLNYQRKLEIGNELLKQNQLEEAEKTFLEAEKIVKKKNQEKHPDVIMDINKYFEINGYKEKAIKYLLQAIKIKKKKNIITEKDIWMFNEIGMNLRKKGKRKEAMNYYQTALSLNENDGIIYYNIGMAYMEGGIPAKAIEYFQKVEELSPSLIENNPNLNLNIGIANYKIERFKHARKYFEKTLELNPQMKKAKQLLEKIS